MKRWEWVVLGVILVVGYGLRVMFLPQGALTFGYDQARDAFVTREILAGDFKILGPPASTPGLYHGVFYYYFLAPAYAISMNPVIAAAWTALFNVLAGGVVFLLAWRMTGRKAVGLLAAGMHAISFEATQYAIWLSNPTLGVWSVPLMYLGLWLWVKEGNKWGPVLAALGLGMSIQAEVFLLYQAMPLGLWLWVMRAKVKTRELGKFGVVFLITVSSMVVAEIKFGFRGISGALSLLATQESVRVAKSLGDFLVLYLNQLGRVFAFSSYPGNIGYGGMLVLGLIVAALWRWNKRKMSWEPFLASWLFSHVTVVSVGGTSTPFLLVGIGPAVSILLGIWVNKWWDGNQKALAFLLTLLVVYGNVSMILKENSYGQTIFSIQNEMTLERETAAIDYTYSESGGNAFSVNTVTSPLWVNNVWAYLYSWYGQERYGYKPEWRGKNQVGQLASGILIDAQPGTEQHFLILEPLQGIPPRFVEETIAEENGRSEMIDESVFGEIVVQNRRNTIYE